MEATGASTDVLLQKPWLPVAIDSCQLLAKCFFGETRYHILLTDLHCVWEETLHSTGIQTRAQELNKRLQAPVKAFFSHLCEVVQPCLSASDVPPKGEAAISVMQLDAGDLILRLKSKLAGLPFYWEFRCTPAPVTVVCLHLVQPLLSMSHVLNRQVEQLGDLVSRKDAEIQDYKENGATLSRARLQTDIFERHIYKDSFLEKALAFLTSTAGGGIERCGYQTLPVVCSDHHGIWDFGGDLQELYTAIVSHRITRKHKLSEQDQLVTTDPDPTASSGAEAGAEGGKADSEPNHISPVEEVGDHMVHTAKAPQLVACDRAERASSKAKKKKVVGLFR